MKKIYLSLFTIISFFVFVIGVKAYDRAKAPTSIPNTNSLMYGTRSNSDLFDYSAISFRNGSETTPGYSELYKIKISDGFINNGTVGKKLNDNWFSAYCLDPNVQYPINGIARRISETDTQMPDNQNIFESAIRAALYNLVDSSNMYTLFEKLNQFNGPISIDYDVPSEYMNGENKLYGVMLNKIANGEDVVIDFKSLTRSSIDLSDSVTLTADEINQAIGMNESGYVEGYELPETSETYSLTLNIANTYFDHYMVNNMGSSVDYKRVLWIIEHSYPTLSLARLYTDAGVDATTINSQLLSLSGNSTLTDEEKIDGYIYSTVQYAIWHVLGKKVENKTIGDELVGSSELNKIYQYLIKDRNVYSTYGDKVFTSEISITKPSGVNEIYEESTDSIKYGPYSVKSGMVSTGKISLSSNNTTDVKIVDANDNVISSVNENEKFFVVVQKKNDATSIVITATAANGYTFVPSSNRGRVYYSVSPMVQNVVSGGIIRSVSDTKTLDILVSPKTGIPNIALLFIVTLVIFTVGYFLIIKTNKKVELK